MNETFTPEQAAAAIDEALEPLPAEAAPFAVETLCAEALYPVALALFRRYPGIPEGRVYEILMHQARLNGHDEGLVFCQLYE